MNKKTTMRQQKGQCMLIFCILITTALGLSLRKQSHNQLNHQLFKDNLDVKNWYYGNMGPTQYRLRIFKMTATGALDICPIIAPFSSSDNTKCENCPLETPLRNLQTNLCEKCPSGYVYSPNNGNCSLPLPVYDANATANTTGIITDQTTINPKQVVPNTVPYASSVNVTNSSGYKSSGGSSSWGDQTTILSNATTTPTAATTNTSNATTSSNTSGSGVADNNTATNTSGNVTNTTSNTTTVSPTSANSTVGTTNETNNTNGSITSTNATAVNTTTVNTTTVNTTTVNTTTVTPVMNNTITQPTKMLNNTSVEPITNTTVNTNATSSTNGSSAGNQTNNISIVTPNITVPVIQANQSAQGSKEYNCSSAQPLYNAQTKKCEACPATYEYIMASNICLPEIWKMNSKATNFIQPSANYVNDLNQKLIFNHPTRVIKECPSNMPYLVTQNNASTCVSCNASQFFAVLTMKCIDGCPQGTLYNNTQNVCSPGMYATNPDTKNIASPTMKYDKWKQELTKLQKVTQNSVIFCPEQTPYASNGTCIQCPSDKPYFNIDNQKCIGCKEGKVFSEPDRRCKGILSPQGTTQKYNNPSLMRMFVNLF